MRLFMIFTTLWFFFRTGKTFRIFVLLPLLPAFEGDIASDTGNALRTILHFNYISICRGSESLMKQIQSYGINPANYVSFCSLRQHGEILSMPVTELIYIHSKLMIIGNVQLWLPYEKIINFHDYFCWKNSGN